MRSSSLSGSTLPNGADLHHKTSKGVMTDLTTLVPTIGRAITRARVKEAAPEEFRALTDPYRGLCQAIEFRGARPTDDKTVKAREVGGGKLKAIEDAPGSFVKVRNWA